MSEVDVMDEDSRNLKKLFAAFPLELELARTQSKLTLQHCKSAMDAPLLFPTDGPAKATNKYRVAPVPDTLMKTRTSAGVASLVARRSE